MASSVLIVEPDDTDRNNMRQTLCTLGFGGVIDVSSIKNATAKLEQRKFSHIVFSARASEFPATAFVATVMDVNPRTVMIVSSYEPSADDVFELLVLGARGFLVKPFSTDSLEQAIVCATKRDAISSAILEADDRNEALVTLVMQALDKAATVLRDARQFETAKREIPRALAALRQASDLASLFAKGGIDSFAETLQRLCLERAEGPASRLGRIRKRLHKQRDSENGP